MLSSASLCMPTFRLRMSCLLCFHFGLGKESGPKLDTFNSVPTSARILSTRLGEMVSKLKLRPQPFSL